MNLTAESNFLYSVSLPEDRGYPEARAIAPASCGELMRGFSDGEPFVVSCPVNVYCEAKVKGAPPPEITVSEATDAVAIRAALSKFADEKLGLSVELQRLSRKGLCTATAHLAAAAFAAAAVRGRPATLSVAKESWHAADPFDGVTYPGVTLFHPRSGRVIESLGAPPSLAFVLVESEGASTEGNEEALRQHDTEMRVALEMLKRGFRTTSAKLVASATTVATRCLVDKGRYAAEVLLAGRDAGILGVAACHQGRFIAAIFEPERCAIEPLMEKLERALGPNKLHGILRLVGGGARLIGRPKIHGT